MLILYVIKIQISCHHPAADNSPEPAPLVAHANVGQGRDSVTKPVLSHSAAETRYGPDAQSKGRIYMKEGRMMNSIVTPYGRMAETGSFFNRQTEVGGLWRMSRHGIETEAQAVLLGAWCCAQTRCLCCRRGADT